MKNKPSLMATCCRYFFAKKILLLTILLLLGSVAQAQILAWQFALPEPTKGVESGINLSFIGTCIFESKQLGETRQKNVK